MGVKSRFTEIVMQPFEKGPYMRPVSETENTALTVGFCCVEALLGNATDKEYVPGDEKLKRFALATRIQESMQADEDLALSMGEQQYLNTFMEQKWNTDVYCKCHATLYRNEDVTVTDIK